MPSRLIIFSTRSQSLQEFLRLDHLNNEEAIHMDRIINKYSDLFRLPKEPYMKESQPMTHKY